MNKESSCPIRKSVTSASANFKNAKSSDFFKISQMSGFLY